MCCCESGRRKIVGRALSLYELSARATVTAESLCTSAALNKMWNVQLMWFGKPVNVSQWGDGKVNVHWPGTSKPPMHECQGHGTYT